MEKMTRGEIAKCAGVSRETVRYYEKRELIPTPSCTAAGYRQYTDEYAERIKEALTRLIACCGGNGPTTDCPILEAMRDAEVFQEVVQYSNPMLPLLNPRF